MSFQWKEIKLIYFIRALPQLASQEPHIIGVPSKRLMEDQVKNEGKSGRSQTSFVSGLTNFTFVCFSPPATIIPSIRNMITNLFTSSCKNHHQEFCIFQLPVEVHFQMSTRPLNSNANFAENKRCTNITFLCQFLINYFVHTFSDQVNTFLSKTLHYTPWLTSLYKTTFLPNTCRCLDAKYSIKAHFKALG